MNDSKLNILQVKLCLFLFFATFAFHAFSQDAIRQKHFLTKKGVAIGGYDPVSYFSGKPIVGNTSFTYQHQGITYRFINANNRETFKKTPSTYEPAYGGWCAYAMGAKGEKVEIDPENYKIVGGKIHLFYKNFFNNTLDDWNKDETQLKAKANKNWLKLNK